MKIIKTKEKIVFIIAAITILIFVSFLLIMLPENLKNYTNINEKITEEEAEQKIKNEIDNLITEKNNELKVPNLNDLIEYLQDSMQTKKETETSIIVGIDEYAFRVDENLEITGRVNLSLLSGLEMNYIVNSINGNKENITVIASSDIAISEIVTPDGRQIFVYSDDKNKIAVDYTINSNQNYIFKLKLKGKEDYEECELKSDSIYEPNIIQNNIADAYPIITSNGTILNKYLQIDYSEGINNYYSIDNGETWKFYNGLVRISKDSIVWAKSRAEGEITKIDKKNIKLELASDALDTNAYDGNEGTYIETNTEKFIYVDSTMYGKNLKIIGKNLPYTFKFYNSNGEVLKTVSKTSWTSQSDYTTPVTVPTGTVKIGYVGRIHDQNGNWSYLYEIGPDTVPIISVAEKIYPTIKTTGVEQPYNNITINYFPTSVQKLYKIDNGDWQSYQNTAIRVDIGKTIYAKGIDSNGKETGVVSYKAVVADDALGTNAYDGNEGTYIETNTEKFIYVDSTMYGKNLKIVGKNLPYTFKFYNSNGEVLKTVSKTSWTAQKDYETPVTVPTGTVKIGYVGRIHDQNGNWSYLYEIGPE